MHWKLLADYRPDGHAYYQYDDNMVSIADCSGRTPDECDDGILFLDFDRSLTFTSSGGLRIPLEYDLYAAASNVDEMKYVLRLFQHYGRCRCPLCDQS